MRQWRVGTFSMGATLLLLGIGLLLTQIVKLDIGTIMISWWPVLFIVLGIEILLYLFIGKKEQAYIKFDILSIFFIGVIGTVGIGLTTVQAVGLDEVLKQQIVSQNKTIELPKHVEKIPKQIKRIYIDANYENVHLEAMDGDEMALFGTVEGQALPTDTIEKSAEYVQVEQQGDTLFLKLKKPQLSNRVNNWFAMDTTIILPSHIDVEFKQSDQLEFDARKVKADWTISDISHLRLIGAQIENDAIDAEGEIDTTQIKLADKHAIKMNRITGYEKW